MVALFQQWFKIIVFLLQVISIGNDNLYLFQYLWLFCDILILVFYHKKSTIHKECFDKWNELGLRRLVHQANIKYRCRMPWIRKNEMERNSSECNEGQYVFEQRKSSFHGHRHDSNSRNHINCLQTLKLKESKMLFCCQQTPSGKQLSKNGTTTYFSPTIHNEIIEFLGKKLNSF